MSGNCAGIFILFLAQRAYFAVPDESVIGTCDCNFVFCVEVMGGRRFEIMAVCKFYLSCRMVCSSDKMLFPSMIMFMLIFIEAYIYLIGESLWLTVFHKERAVTFHQGKIQLEQLWDIGFSILFLSLVYTACSYVLGDYFESNRIFFSLIGILMTNKLVSARIPHKKIWTICMLTVYSLLSFTFWGGYDFRTLGMTVILVVVTAF